MQPLLKKSLDKARALRARKSSGRQIKFSNPLIRKTMGKANLMKRALEDTVVVTPSGETYIKTPRQQPDVIKTPHKVKRSLTRGKNPIEVEESFVTEKPANILGNSKPVNSTNYKELSKNPLFDKLRPLKSMMKSTLAMDGISTKGMPLAKIANLFNKHIVQNSDNYHGKNIDLNRSYWDNLNDTTVQSLIDGIFGYVRNVEEKDKKLGNVGLTKIENFIATQMKRLRGKTNELAKREASTELGSKILFDKKFHAIIAIIFIVVLYFFIFKK